MSISYDGGAEEDAIKNMKSKTASMKSKTARLKKATAKHKSQRKK